ncbi:hypothetical protein AAFF_G00398930 [Aldrovandia affinis]|uniref:Uncharacterized protein n=1 Tax=Aldrovandia affinis TaxID=143900 RepID=A0AAD7WL90_9TELE|nr:hypothetical protein AAFF_G00398930 [Aldrovandia affinis]
MGLQPGPTKRIIHGKRAATSSNIIIISQHGAVGDSWAMQLGGDYGTDEPSRPGTAAGPDASPRVGVASVRRPPTSPGPDGHRFGVGPYANTV